MNRRAGRRRVRKRRTPGENSRMKFGAIAGIMIVIIFLGYLTARLIIGPLIGYNADESPVQTSQGQKEENKEKDDKKAETKEKATKDEKQAKETTAAVPTEGYALQFGAFSTREAAEKLADTLKAQGIRTKIITVDDTFKVISQIVETKEEALTALDEVADKAVSDVFVASFK